MSRLNSNEVSIEDLGYSPNGRWNIWSGGDDAGPSDLEPDTLIELCRRGPNAGDWRISPSHQLKWRHDGGAEDILMWRHLHPREEGSSDGAETQEVTSPLKALEDLVKACTGEVEEVFGGEIGAEMARARKVLAAAAAAAQTGGRKS